MKRLRAKWHEQEVRYQTTCSVGIFKISGDCERYSFWGEVALNDYISTMWSLKNQKSNSCYSESMVVRWNAFFKKNPIPV